MGKLKAAYRLNQSVMRTLSKILKFTEPELLAGAGSFLPAISSLMSMGKTYSAGDGMMSAPMMKKWGTIFTNTFGLPILDMMKGHWRAFGWDGETGVPTSEIIAKLELNKLVKDVGI